MGQLNAFTVLPWNYVNSPAFWHDILWKNLGNLGILQSICFMHYIDNLILDQPSKIDGGISKTPTLQRVVDKPQDPDTSIKLLMTNVLRHA